MALFLFKTLVAALVVSLCSWLAGKRPVLAGFIVALPLTSLMVLPFSLAEHGDPARTSEMARSIFVGVPVTMLFFLPFLVNHRTGMSFGWCYITGLLLLTGGFFLHNWVVRSL